ncbi:transcriptional regulator [Rhodobacteraceae bacterium 2CG4]|uniref:Transcriptional regulator n=1 Tax=Halovulum marinum TaxID=2662447 RepID=A0A6L5Z3K1_9RHOB|nr:transcriptional regulator [Halovulum marinum]MSU91107.1 transcriptional regulator [Halovulum marinum]
MLGKLCVLRNGRPVELPPSRKVRALLGYLAVADNPVGRSRLCEIMGDLPSDPRAELRWYLSKIRAVLDGPGRRRVVTDGDMVSLDLDGAAVDAVEIERAALTGLENTPTPELRRLAPLFAGDFLEGFDLNRSPQLDHWLTTQRSHFRDRHAQVLAGLIGRLPADGAEARALAERWVILAPFEPPAHRALMSALPPAAAERHLAAAVRLFEAEGMDPAPLRAARRAVRAAPAAVPATELPTRTDPAPQGYRASLAVMPFRESEAADGQAQLGAGLTRDIIARLAKLRALFVIAYGSVSALAERGLEPAEAARILNVDYLACGAVLRRGDRIRIDVEMAETRSARLLWAETYDAAVTDPFEVFDRIGDSIVQAIASEVETVEKNRAVLKPPNSLNAWEAFHRGLWHMYRFTRADNAEAQEFFRRSIAADPTFSRAHAGLSFTHWQNAFQNWQDRTRETDLAIEAAGCSLMADDHDPGAHWAMGRALWLRRDEAPAVGELEQAVRLSPNFAQGHYALSFVNAQTGDAEAAIGSADLSGRLSPFDPMLFAIHGARAMAHVRLGRFEQAADSALQATARPNAHALIHMIAAFCLVLAGRTDEAGAVAATLRRAHPGYRIDEFLHAFRFPADIEQLYRRAAVRLQLD